MAVVADLGERPVVELLGPDARRFANGMFTNNVRDLPVGAAQRSAMTDDRGRVLGLMDLYAVADDRFMLVLEGMSAEDFVARYERYVVFDDVEMVEHGMWPLHAVQGEDAVAKLATAGLGAPPPGTMSRVGDTIVASRRRGAEGFDVVGPSSLVADPDGAERVAQAQALAGEVCFPRDVVAPALPHEHGLREAVLHFEKGCYLGQESIHRIEVMGKPRRTLAGVHTAERPQPGVVLHDGKKVGVATQVVEHPQGGWFSLAVVKKPCHEVGTSLEVAGVLGVAVALPVAP